MSKIAFSPSSRGPNLTIKLRELQGANYPQGDGRRATKDVYLVVSSWL